MIKNAISQTFFVSEKTGCFVTKVRLYVYSKATDLPLKLQIRDTVNGYPGSNIVTGSDVIVNPADISASSSALVDCDFSFNSPIYLESDKQYSIVVYTDSADYSLWSTRVGTVDITGKFIDSHPTAGYMFTSQNGSTWMPSSSDNLSFVVYKAKFDISQAGEFVAVNAPPSYKKLQNNPIQTFAGKSMVRVYHPNHGLYDGDYTYIDGISIGEVVDWTVLDDVTIYPSGAPAIVFTGGGASVQAIGTVILSSNNTIRGVNITNPGVGYTSIPTVKVSGVEGKVSVEISPPGNGYSVSTFGKDSTKKMLQVVNVNPNSYMINLGVNATESGYIGGRAVSATENLTMDTALVRAELFIPPQTSVYCTRQTSANGAVQGTDSIFLHRNYDLPVTQKIYSEVNERTKLAGQKSFTLNAIMSSKDENLSPTIDATSLQVNTIGNRVNSPNKYNYVAGYDDPAVITGTGITFSSTGFTSTDATVATAVDTLQIGKPIYITGFAGGFINSISITNPGTGYSSPVVTIGTAWVGSVSVIPGNQRVNNGKIYTCTTGGITAASTGPTGTSSSITDNTVVWSYAGENATATATAAVSGGAIQTVTVTNPGYGYIDPPSVAITGAGSNAAVSSNISTNNGVFIVSDIQASGNNRTVSLVLDSGITLGAGQPTTANVIMKQLTNFADDIIPVGTSNSANYLSTVMTLSNQSTGFKIYFDLNLPNEADVNIFYRVDKISSSNNIKKKIWIEIGSDGRLVKSPNTEQFTETVYTMQDISQFDQIQVKIAMKTTNTAKIPRIKNLRIIAVA
jgi:hypothetical protein